MSAGRLIRLSQLGSRRFVRFSVNGLEYSAGVLGDSCVTLHRVEAGKYTSIAVSSPRFPRVTRVLWGLLKQQQQA